MKNTAPIRRRKPPVEKKGSLAGIKPKEGASTKGQQVLPTKPRQAPPTKGGHEVPTKPKPAPQQAPPTKGKLPVLIGRGKRISFPVTERKQALSELNLAMRRLQSVRAGVRNNRPMTVGTFRNFDQKANQLYNLLASLTRTMKAMREQTIRNIR